MGKTSKLIPTCLAGVFMAIAITPSGADELFIPYQAVSLPNAGILGAFDISFVALRGKRWVNGGETCRSRPSLSGTF
jgi:hypothetical protein